MKTIMIISFVAMLSAGITGAADFITDLKSGTLIEYNDQDDDGSEAKQTTIPKKKSAMIITPSSKTKLEIKVAQAVADEKAEEKIKKKKFNPELYSRGNPNIEDEEVIIEEPDSTIQANP
jgi:hypothetical protein